MPSNQINKIFIVLKKKLFEMVYSLRTRSASSAKSVSASPTTETAPSTKGKRGSKASTGGPTKKAKLDKVDRATSPKLRLSPTANAHKELVKQIQILHVERPSDVKYRASLANVQTSIKAQIIKHQLDKEISQLVSQ